MGALSGGGFNLSSFLGGLSGVTPANAATSGASSIPTSNTAATSTSDPNNPANALSTDIATATGAETDPNRQGQGYWDTSGVYHAPGEDQSQ